MIAGSFGRYLARTARDHGLYPTLTRENSGFLSGRVLNSAEIRPGKLDGWDKSVNSLYFPQPPRLSPNEIAFRVRPEFSGAATEGQRLTGAGPAAPGTRGTSEHHQITLARDCRPVGGPDARRGSRVGQPGGRRTGPIGAQ